MNYKKIFRTRKVRRAILNALRFVPDRPMLRLQYRIKLGRALNLKDPKRYTEKLQWYKLNYRDPLMAQCVDKYDVRAYVESVGLGELLNECYGVYDRAEDVDFDALPDSFVLKDTLGGGGLSVILVPDKSRMDREAVRRQMQEWTEKKRVRSGGREWPYYSGKKHRIIAEKYLAQPDGDLPDFKFFCFDGKVRYMYYMRNYTRNHAEGELGFFDPDFRLLPAHRSDFRPMTEQPPRPEGFDRMLAYAQRLSAAFPHVRVDFFSVDGQIVFGEMTFFMASGYMTFVPDAFDEEMGAVWQLPQARRGDC